MTHQRGQIGYFHFCYENLFTLLDILDVPPSVAHMDLKHRSTFRIGYPLFIPIFDIFDMYFYVLRGYAMVAMFHIKAYSNSTTLE